MGDLDGGGVSAVEVPLGQRQTVPMTVIAQDPLFVNDEGGIVLASASVPAERLAPGPWGHRFHVVDYDSTTGDPHGPMSLTADGDEWTYRDAYQASAGGPELVADFGFHAQNVYAVASRILGLFERHLGRRLPWDSHEHPLYLVPHAFIEANAFYSPNDHAVLFGYLPGEDGEPTTYTCLSHDIVAHEVTHAIVDGIRPRFLEPGLPDQPAFHEGFADVVALLSVFSLKGASGADGQGPAAGVIEALLSRPLAEDAGPVRAVPGGRIAAERVTVDALRNSALTAIAEQFGRTVSGGRSDALRRSVLLPEGGDWRNLAEYREPHRRGEVVVAAVMSALLDMWTARIAAMVGPDDTLDLGRVAEEGRTAAEHLLGMCIRALDYTPPVDLTFEDFLDALLVADTVVVPDDDHGYRASVTAAFERYGVKPPEPSRVEDLAAGGIRARYPQVNFAALGVDRDEVFRFIWSNTELLGLDLSFWLRVERVRHATRVGPDGLVVSEIVADYVQSVDTTIDGLVTLGAPLDTQVEDSTGVGGPLEGPGVTGETEVQLWGGGVIVFDQFGGAKCHQAKRLFDWDHQLARLGHLIERSITDRDHRFGFADGEGTLRFADLHSRGTAQGEAW